MELFDRQTVERMTHFKALLEEVVADPQRPPSELQLLGEAERQQPSDVVRKGGTIQTHRLIESPARQPSWQLREECRCT